MIFETPSRRRWYATLTFFSLCLAVFAFWLGMVIWSVWNGPKFPAWTAEIVGTPSDTTAAEVANAGEQRIQRYGFPIPEGTLPAKRSPEPSRLRDRDQDGKVRMVWLSGTDTLAQEAIFQEREQIDIAIVGEMRVDSTRCETVHSMHPPVTWDVEDRLRWMQLSIPGDLTWLNDASSRECAIRSVFSTITEEGAHGILVDFSGTFSDQINAQILLSELASALHVQDLPIGVRLSAFGSGFDLQTVSSDVDAVVVRFPSATEIKPDMPPGPFAYAAFSEAAMQNVLHAVPASKLIWEMPNGGVDGRLEGGDTKSISLADLFAIAAKTGSKPWLDLATGHFVFAYRDASGTERRTWFVNGYSTWVLEQRLQFAEVAGYAMPDLGHMDPFWFRLQKLDASRVSGRMITPALDAVTQSQDREVFRVSTSPKSGVLSIERTALGQFGPALYLSVPSGFVLEPVGKPIPAGVLVMTFDDGPDSEWTIPIQGTLRALDVPATFFLVGHRIQAYPEYVERGRGLGFDVGNHTYTHREVTEMDAAELRMELHTTERLIQSIAGSSSRLFRFPYDVETSGFTHAELKAMAQISELGYAITGSHIDGSDWSRPGAEVIAQSIETQAKMPGNHVIVLHDAFGDRAQTVEALQIVIPRLRSQGFVFRSLDEAIGLPSEMLFPTVPSWERFPLSVISYGVTGLSEVWQLILFLFALTTFISIARLVVLSFLVLRSGWWKRREEIPTPQQMPVTVLIPAYNEEATIEKTLRTLQQSTYQNFVALVIDDGSKDATSEVVQHVAMEDARIQLLRKENGGKSTALNAGLEFAQTDIVVTIDADTIILPDTIGELLRPFVDPSVDAVCGNVEVGNISNLLTGFQALEYITSQNFDRRAFEVLNCISVVPGATGAWRRTRLLEIGGYAHDTLTEDADITLRLLRAGGKIVYAADARSRTEAPETVEMLAKQRFRWTYGTYQCLWKHRSAFLKGSLGWFAIPNTIFFQVLFPILGPIGDVLFLFSLFAGDPGTIILTYFAFLSMDVVGSGIAVALERQPKKILLLLLLQRFFYRQFMYVMAFRSILAILRGRRHGWGSLKRTGSVSVQPQVL